MSLDALKWVFDRSPLTGTALLVHLAMADIAGDEDVVYVRQSILGVRARTTRSTVNRVLGDLIDRGLIVAEGLTPGGVIRYRMVLAETAPVIGSHKREHDPKPGQSAPTRKPARPPVPRLPAQIGTPPPGPADASSSHLACAQQTPDPSHVDTRDVPGSHTEPVSNLPVNQPTNNPSPQPARKGGHKGRQYTDEAQLLATAEWERRTIKPAIGFVGFRKGIDAALAAGHTVEALARVLPSMSNFSPNAFDFVLGTKTAGGRGGLRSVPPPSTDREAPTGRIAT